jgi:hypothetical protein
LSTSGSVRGPGHVDGRTPRRSPRPAHHAGNPECPPMVNAGRSPRHAVHHGVSAHLTRGHALNRARALLIPEGVSVGDTRDPLSARQRACGESISLVSLPSCGNGVEHRGEVASWYPQPIGRYLPVQRVHSFSVPCQSDSSLRSDRISRSTRSSRCRWTPPPPILISQAGRSAEAAVSSAGNVAPQARQNRAPAFGAAPHAGHRTAPGRAP